MMIARAPFRTRGGLAWMTGLLILTPLAAFSFTIPGDPGDGEIRFDDGSVVTASEEISIGHRGSNGSELATAIYFFELPDLASSDEVNNASLLFSFVDRSGSFATNPANADIWGLGYVASPTINTNWHLLGDSDTRTGDDLGTGIGANPVVKLANDFLTDESRDPAGGSYRMALPASSLAEYIGFLYDQGAVSGNYAVVRINVDEATSSGNRGFDLASADAVDEATRPVLSINENTTLLFDPFTDGDRSNGADPFDTDWYTITGDLTLSVVDESAGIGDGNALEVFMDVGGRLFLCGFPSITLADPGDFLQFSCLFRPTYLGSTPTFDENFRIGVLSSGGAPLIADTTTSSDANHYGGYMVRMSTEPTADLATIQTAASDSFLGSSASLGSDFLERNAGSIDIDVSTIYSFVYTITRTSETQMTTRINLNDVILNGMDPGTDPDAADWTFSDTFDALGMGGKSGAHIDFFLDNVRVETSVPLVQIVPHTEVLADVIELEVDTQPFVRYALQHATDLVTSNWTGSGYILTGDGTSRRIYDPNAVEPAKLYRMENQ